MFLGLGTANSTLDFAFHSVSCYRTVFHCIRFHSTFALLSDMANIHRDGRQSRFSLLQSPDRNPARSSSRLTERSSTPSPTGSHSDLLYVSEQIRTPIILGVCAMDIKARSKAMREILTRLVERARGGVEVKVFGDKVILDEGVLLPPLLQT